VRELVGAADAVHGLPFDGPVLAGRLREREAAQLEAFELALALAVEVAGAALRAHEGWVDGLRAGLVALLGFFDEEPVLARYLVVGSGQAGPAVLARRGEVLERLAAVLDDERAPARSYPPPLTAHAVASGVLGVLHARLSEPEPGVLAELAGSLMSFTVLPFLGVRAARRELRRSRETVSSSAAGVDLVQDPGRRLSHRREIRVLGVLAGEPGLNSTQVGLRAGIEDRAHVSRLMGRLARLGLIENTAASGRTGVKAWRLTGSGEQLHAEIGREARVPAGVVLGLPAELRGRLDFWAVCVLRAVGEQPWLTGSELAARAGVDPGQIAGLLGLLAGLGLVDSVREAHRKGAPKVWQITERGRELDQRIGRDAPAPPPSVALGLMRESGGRLSEPAIRVLREVAGEPRLSNREIAHRVRIADANSMSHLLARLAERGLIENARNGGRENVWVLSAAGRALEGALREEVFPPVSRTVALDVLKEAGGRLNHRVVTVLGAIGAESGLSNQEIAERLGVTSKAHTSKLLARLARFGLIENQAPDTTPFQPNAWRLTNSGKQLQAAIQHDRPDAHHQPHNEHDTNPAAGLTLGGGELTRASHFQADTTREPRRCATGE
jgi:DNA-binding MarR family transcriptional regulator